MLVLTREQKDGKDCIVVGDMKIWVLSEGRVKLGFDAPKDIRIQRGELLPVKPQRPPMVK